MLHQSHASVPPAPEWRVTIASLASYGPDRSVRILIDSNVSWNLAISSLTSGRTDSSSSSFAISISINVSSYRFSSFAKASMPFLRAPSSFWSFCAFSGFSQNPGSAIVRSSSSALFSLLSRSRDERICCMGSSYVFSWAFSSSNSSIQLFFPAAPAADSYIFAKPHRKITSPCPVSCGTACTSFRFRTSTGHSDRSSWLLSSSERGPVSRHGSYRSPSRPPHAQPSPEP